ncbi:MAG: Arc family DNA-binding protein [Pyrinomonadaceae bacterium]
MATLTIRNVPSELYEALTQKAKRRHRSLNSEVIIQLQTVLGQREMDVETELEEIRLFREKLKGLHTTEEEVNREKNRGRL